jgi:hypothetical protein
LPRKVSDGGATNTIVSIENGLAGVWQTLQQIAVNVHIAKLTATAKAANLLALLGRH